VWEIQEGRELGIAETEQRLSAYLPDEEVARV